MASTLSKVKNTICNGFTLLELLVVLFIISVLFFLVFSFWRHWIFRQQMSVAANQLITIVQFARSVAVHRGKRVVLCGSDDGQHCQGSWNVKQFILRLMTGRVLRTFSGLGKRYRLFLHSSFGKNDALRIDSNGFTVGQKGSFYICSARVSLKDAIRIVILRTGHTRLTSLRGASASEVCR